ncbi:hypothetical protein BU14_0819s0004 [Porphyra umbilicalis]|uniref:Uncharacterized protein n=1 Tax=Porphyra umbilicalis TaxID=2786 RepID=A0A1X6NNT1_PORUM|nr:hypothetical protein BU14_0819s0004 [Porphyra umbilicalis]|eukprot:OSX70271.1 hypothetical protein BU14_0819s0004 [Porphyra umbilicalis]
MAAGRAADAGCRGAGHGSGGDRQAGRQSEGGASPTWVALGSVAEVPPALLLVFHFIDHLLVRAGRRTPRLSPVGLRGAALRGASSSDTGGEGPARGMARSYPQSGCGRARPWPSRGRAARSKRRHQAMQARARVAPGAWNTDSRWRPRHPRAIALAPAPGRRAG